MPRRRRVYPSPWSAGRHNTAAGRHNTAAGRPCAKGLVSRPTQWPGVPRHGPVAIDLIPGRHDTMARGPSPCISRFLERALCQGSVCSCCLVPRVGLHVLHPFRSTLFSGPASFLLPPGIRPGTARAVRVLLHGSTPREMKEREDEVRAVLLHGSTPSESLPARSWWSSTVRPVFRVRHPQPAHGESVFRGAARCYVFLGSIETPTAWCQFVGCL